MDEIATIARALEAGEAPADALARVGEAEPQRACEAFARARARAGLAEHFGRWAPEALRSARPAYAAESLVELAELGAPLPPGALPVLARVLGNSTFLARLLQARPLLGAELAPDAEGWPPPPAGPVAPAWDAIREAKYRGLLRVAARDASGRPFRAGLGELSDLADACLGAALACAAQETGVEAPTLLALGKLGGRELNFSSDVDVLFVYEVPGDAEADFARNADVARLVRSFRAGLEARGELGFGYRVDLELRPEGPTGPLANSVDAALGYYESFGAEWERQAMIRLRHVAGPAQPARALAEGLAPFVWRRSISPAALQAVREMKHRIEHERRSAGRDLEGDLKEGPGGIRDVEFLVQALQLFVGGREPRVRTGNVLDGLDALAAIGALPVETAAALADAYLWLRRAEHSVQLDEERQTHAFPRDARAQRALARRMGYGEADAGSARARLLDEWTAVRTEVRAHFDELLPGEDA
jgi:glutamate-ammonia-ligase adenylyltransferase